MRLFYLLVVRQMAQKPVRPVFAALGVALGIALFVAVTMINRATIDYFKESVMSVAGSSRIAVTGDDTGFPEELLDVVDNVPGVRHAAPSMELRARFTAADGRDQTLVVLGIDLLRETGVRAYHAEDAVIDDPLAFLNQEDSIIVTRPFATEHHLAIGSKFELTTAAGKKPFTVRGVLTPEGPAKAFGGNVAIMDIDGARVSFGREGLTDRIDVVPRDGVDEAALAAAIEKAVGPGVRVERPESQAKTFERMVASQQAALSFMSTLALVIAIFLIANTMAISVAERRKDIGVVRAVGASRARVVSVFVLEACALGLAGAALGVVAGRALAERMVGIVSRGLSAQLVTPIEVGDVTLRPKDAVGALAVGVVSALLAAAWPAYQASRVAPVEALAPKDTTLADRASRASVIGAAVGALLLATLAAAALTGVDRTPAFGRMSSAIAITGFALVAPHIAVVLIDLARRALARLAPTSAPIVRFACENLLSHRRRTASSVLSLVIGLSLVIVNATVQASFRAALLDSIDRTLLGDVYVSTKGRFLSANVQPMREDVARDIEAIPGAEHGEESGARALRLVFVGYRGKRVAVKAWDPMPEARLPFRTIDRDAKDAARALFAPDGAPPAVLVSESFAQHFGARAGETIELDAPGGRLVARVAGVATDYASPEGTIVMSRALYKKYWRDSLVTVFYVFARPGADVARLREGLDARVCLPRGLVSSLVGDARRGTEQMLDDSFAYSRAIELAALIVGLLGLLNTVFINVLERTRELGMLRAIGMSVSQLRRMIFSETVLLGMSAAIAAVLLGAYLARVSLGGTLSATMGWSIPIHVPLAAISRALGAGVVVGAVAGLAAARRASRATIKEALESE